MECPSTLQWIATEVVLGAIDVALANLRHRVITLAKEGKRRRYRVRWYKHLRDLEVTEEAAHRWDWVLNKARQERNTVEHQYYQYKFMYTGYRAYHNIRWGLHISSPWRSLPAFARRGYSTMISK